MLTGRTARYNIMLTHVPYLRQQAARESYQRALDLDESLTAARRAISECRKHEREQDEKDRARYKGMFG